MPIYVRITVDGQRVELTAGRECNPKIWNVEAGRAKGTKEEVRALNTYLDNLQAQINEAHYQQTVSGVQITADHLKNRLLSKAGKVRTLLSVFRDHNQKIAALVNQEYAPGIVERYEIACRHTENFIKWNTKKLI